PLVPCHYLLPVCFPAVLLKPNAGPQPRLAARARHERTLAGVGCRPMLAAFKALADDDAIEPGPGIVLDDRTPSAFGMPSRQEPKEWCNRIAPMGREVTSLLYGRDKRLPP